MFSGRLLAHGAPTHTSERGGLVSSLIVFWITVERPSLRSVTRTRYSPSGARVLLELVLTDDDDDIPAASGGGRRVIHRADVLDIEDLRDVVALGARAGLVHDDGCGDAPVRVVAGLDVRRAIAGLG